MLNSILLIQTTFATKKIVPFYHFTLIAGGIFINNNSVNMYRNDKFGQSVPAGLRLGSVKLYLVGDPDHTNILYKSTTAISSNLATAMAMKKFSEPHITSFLYMPRIIQANF